MSRVNTSITLDNRNKKEFTRQTNLKADFNFDEEAAKVSFAPSPKKRARILQGEAVRRREPSPRRVESPRRPPEETPFHYDDVIPQTFAGIWVSDVAPILYTGKGSSQPTQCEGVVAVSGRVPFLISGKDLEAVNIGDELFIAPTENQTVFDRKYYNRMVREPGSMSDGVFPVAGHASHQQLVVAPVSIAPPGDRKCFWGVPQFAPVVFETSGTGALPSEYRMVTGAAHNDKIVDDEPPHVDTAGQFDDGLRTFGILNRAGMDALLDRAVNKDRNQLQFRPETRRKFLADRFIGTLTAKNGPGTAPEVDISAVLVHTV